MHQGHPGNAPAPRIDGRAVPAPLERHSNRTEPPDDHLPGREWLFTASTVALPILLPRRGSCYLSVM